MEKIMSRDDLEKNRICYGWDADVLDIIDSHLALLDQAEAKDSNLKQYQEAEMQKTLTFKEAMELAIDGEWKVKEVKGSE